MSAPPAYERRKSWHRRGFLYFSPGVPLSRSHYCAACKHSINSFLYNTLARKNQEFFPPCGNPHFNHKVHEGFFSFLFLATKLHEEERKRCPADRFLTPAANNSVSRWMAWKTIIGRGCQPLVIIYLEIMAKFVII